MMKKGEHKSGNNIRALQILGFVEKLVESKN